MKRIVPPPPKHQEPRIIKEGQQPEKRDELIIRVGQDTVSDPSEFNELHTFEDMCRIVNLQNIDNFLKDFEQVLRLITIGTEDVDKSKITFGPLRWKED